MRRVTTRSPLLGTPTSEFLSSKELSNVEVGDVDMRLELSSIVGGKSVGSIVDK